tara:strand:- start:1608 stop:2018 length:411 start_codon:yes stop_codon:yes gene_type:complete
MGYAIELSKYINKGNMVTNSSSLDKYITNIANNCDSQYSIHEQSYNKKQQKICYIYVVIYSDNNFSDFINFIKLIKKEKKMYIDCIYQDDVKCDLIYASPNYLKKTDKNFTNTYKYNLSVNTNQYNKKIYDAISSN